MLLTVKAQHPWLAGAILYPVERAALSRVEAEAFHGEGMDGVVIS